jgi:hypothetical protein
VLRRSPTGGDAVGNTAMILAKAQCIDSLFLRHHGPDALPRGGVAHMVLAGHAVLRRALAGRGPDAATGAYVAEPLTMAVGSDASPAAAVARIEMAAYRHVPPDDAAGEGGRSRAAACVPPRLCAPLCSLARLCASVRAHASAGSLECAPGPARAARAVDVYSRGCAQAERADGARPADAPSVQRSVSDRAPA